MEKSALVLFLTGENSRSRDKYLGSIIMSKLMSICRDTCSYWSRDKYILGLSKLMSIGRDTSVIQELICRDSFK